MSTTPSGCTARGQAPSRIVEQFLHERLQCQNSSVAGRAATLTGQLLLDCIPKSLFNNRFVLAFVTQIFVCDLTDVNRIRQNLVQRPSRKSTIAIGATFHDPRLGSNAAMFQVLFKQAYVA